MIECSNCYGIGYTIDENGVKEDCILCLGMKEE